MFIGLSNEQKDSHRDRIEKRIAQLRRDGWKWVKHGPNHPREMCAIQDYIRLSSVSNRSNQLPESTMNLFNRWLWDHTGHRWNALVEYNDHPDGAKSVDDVVTLLEKFAAEL